jgi:hypothetical protein
MYVLCSIFLFLSVIANTHRVLPGAPASIQLIAKPDHPLHVGWRSPPDPHQQINQLEIRKNSNINNCFRYRLTWKSLAAPDTLYSIVLDRPKMDYLIDGLEPDTMYNISLAAGNSHGFGPEIWAQFKTLLASSIPAATKFFYFKLFNSFLIFYFPILVAHGSNRPMMRAVLSLDLKKK